MTILQNIIKKEIQKFNGPVHMLLKKRGKFLGSF